MKGKTNTAAWRMLAGFMLLALLAAGIPAGLQAEGLRDVSVPGDAAQPEKITVPTGAEPGVYYMEYVPRAQGISPASYPVDGAMLFATWAWLQSGPSTYTWGGLDSWMANRKAQGLGTGINVTVYDGTGSGDITSTPNFVIKIPNAVIPAMQKNSSSGTPYESYVNRWRKKNGDFEGGTTNWEVATGSTGVAVQTGSPNDPLEVPADPIRWGAKLGEIDNAAGAVFHSDDAIPAMPVSLNGTLTAEIRARVYIDTTDVNPNDHLFVEVWNTSNVKLGGTELDITNLSHANQTWQDYTFNISAFAHEKTVRVAFRVANDGANPTTFWVDNTQLRVRHLIPNYGNPAFLNAYKSFIATLGARYKDNTDMQFVLIGTGAFGENQPVQDATCGSTWQADACFDWFLQTPAVGLTSAVWLDYMKQVTAAYATAFGAKISPPQGPSRHLMSQYTPKYLLDVERKEITDYSRTWGVGLSYNRLTWDFTQLHKPDYTGGYDPIVAFGNTLPIAFESYEMDLKCAPALSYYALANGLDKHTDYLRANQELFYNYGNESDLQKKQAELYLAAKPYIGQAAQDAPRAYTIMREHANPTIYTCSSSVGAGADYFGANGSLVATKYYSQFGNYNYYLVQDDTVPGGRSIPETNNRGWDKDFARSPDNLGITAPDAGLGNCPEREYRTDLFGDNYPCNRDPYNDKLPALNGLNKSKSSTDPSFWYYPADWNGGTQLVSGWADYQEAMKALFVRRTDQASANPYMFFRVDDGYINGTQTYQATITVEYFDIGSDQWSLRYHSTTGDKSAGTITKTNTNRLKTATFQVTDGRFGNGLTGGTDLYIDSRSAAGASDGNEWVHKVSVEKTGGITPPTETPTPTATPTETPTPTVTPTATPNTGAVEGIAYHDANGNGVVDPGENGLAGATLVLRQGVNDVYTEISGANGAYKFAAVAPGQYIVAEKLPPPGYSPSSFQLFILISANNTLSGINFGHQPGPTPTPTATPTVPPKLNYVPLLLK